MLDQQTKRKIDSARQILVGKVPDPKSQVEQITTALIYKFMDDMDKEAEELGGQAKFFTKDLTEFSWSKLLDRRLSGQDRLDLYDEAIRKFSTAETLPQLFRDIFKDSFLPYRNQETFNLFLKEINEFTYGHSEDLGDAFEYLISIMGSQGDAGQFRTPRHIIDFIVRVVDPKKNETILDPACGTAGFLISAYKYILGKDKDHKLTPDEKQQLTRNVVGYDISPEMVRLSLVNLYLHQFQNPKIYEYDTLTSEERWDDSFDVIMANPPFMSPKGGIRPHKRFQVQAKRSEVLFVDYILEHLNIKGRAGIIVPEGIIFQSSNAYKALRKILVEDNYLYAVISLPVGVFNPYAGVKTSVLLIDKQLAKKTDEILFVKVENDGFDLGAQRRPNGKNDLPEALKILKEWQKKQKIRDAADALLLENRDNLLTEDGGKILLEDQKYVVVKKSKIAESGDYNLTGDRYRETIDYSNAKWPMVKLDEIAKIGAGNSAPQNKKLFKNGKHPFCRTSDVGKTHLSSSFSEIVDKLNDNGIRGLRLHKKNTILFPKSGASIFLNHRVLLAIDSFVSSHLATIYGNKAKIFPKFLYYLLCSVDAKKITNNQSYPSLKLSQISNIKIPLPPLSTQKQIVEELNSYQKVINGAKQVAKNWKPKIKINPKWEKVELENICEITSSKRIFQEEYVASGIPFYRTKEIVELSQGKNISLKLFISHKKYNEIKNKFGTPQKNDILISAVGTIGISWIVPNDQPFYFKDGNLLWLKKIKKTNAKFIKLILDITVANNLHLLTNGAAYNALTIIKLKKLKIPLPSLKIQKQIVKKIKTEQKLVNANKKLIEIFEKKIKEKIEEVWKDNEN